MLPKFCSEFLSVSWPWWLLGKNSVETSTSQYRSQSYRENCSTFKGGKQVWPPKNQATGKRCQDMGVVKGQIEALVCCNFSSIMHFPLVIKSSDHTQCKQALIAGKKGISHWIICFSSSYVSFHASHVCTVPNEARKGNQISWNWIYMGWTVETSPGLWQQL